MALRSLLGWMLHGQANTVGTLDALSADLRDLQARVDALETTVQRAQRTAELDLRDLHEQQLAELNSVRTAVITATDDLSTRIAVLASAAETAEAAETADPTAGVTGVTAS